jgi:hypothetical protein
MASRIETEQVSIGSNKRLRLSPYHFLVPVSAKMLHMDEIVLSLLLLPVGLME